MKNTIRVLALVTAITVSGNAMAQASDPQGKPTIVLVHGAFAETSSWNAVITELNGRGYVAIVAAMRKLPQ